MLWQLPKWQLSSRKGELEAKDYLTIENSARTTIAQIIGGLVLLIGLYFTAENLRTAQESAQNNSLQAQEALKQSQEGQITERFTKSIEHLGNDKLEIRLGGIYALERIARDSDKDYSQIIEILITFIRENAPLNVSEEKISLNTKEGYEHKLRTDIQAIMTVLGRRSKTWTIKDGIEGTLNLSRVNLEGINLNKANFEGTNFYGTNLKWAVINGYFKSSVFTQANLDFASVGGDFQSCNFNNVSLKEADFRNTKLQHSSFSSANLEKTSFYESDCREAVFDNANLKGASFKNANLQKVILLNANLEGVDFTNTHLEGANLEGVRGLTSEQLKSAILDNSTQLPKDLTLPVK